MTGEATAVVLPTAGIQEIQDQAEAAVIPAVDPTLTETGATTTTGTANGLGTDHNAKVLFSTCARSINHFGSAKLMVL